LEQLQETVRALNWNSQWLDSGCFVPGAPSWTSLNDFLQVLEGPVDAASDAV